MELNDGIELVNARIAGEDDDVMLFTDSGRAIRFSTTAVRVFKGRKSTGVRGIKLLGTDKVVSMSVIRHLLPHQMRDQPILKCVVQSQVSR